MRVIMGPIEVARFRKNAATVSGFGYSSTSRGCWIPCERDKGPPLADILQGNYGFNPKLPRVTVRCRILTIATFHPDICGYAPHSTSREATLLTNQYRWSNNTPKLTSEFVAKRCVLDCRAVAYPQILFAGVEPVKRAGRIKNCGLCWQRVVQLSYRESEGERIMDHHPYSTMYYRTPILHKCYPSRVEISKISLICLRYPLVVVRGGLLTVDGFNPDGYSNRCSLRFEGDETNTTVPSRHFEHRHWRELRRSSLQAGSLAGISGTA